MKRIIFLLVLFLPVILSGCYTVVSFQEEPEQLVQANTSAYEFSGSYFDEEDDTNAIDSTYGLTSDDVYEVEEEPGFFENLITEIIYGLSNISSNEDNMIMIFNGDNVVYIVNSENSSSTKENSSTDQNHSSTRNTGDRNYNLRK
ncbi:MAG: hypothetical protein WBN42_09800 [Ignavibacteriaceae bacterium]